MKEGEREGEKFAPEIVCWNKMDEVRIPFHYSSRSERDTLGFFFYIKTFLLAMNYFSHSAGSERLNQQLCLNIRSLI